MKNIHKIDQQIYITSNNEKPNNPDSILRTIDEEGNFTDKKIILTTDFSFIKNGIQAIPDNFLEWFAKNPSCDEVEVGVGFSNADDITDISTYYEIIIPKEETIMLDKLKDYFNNTTKEQL